MPTTKTANPLKEVLKYGQSLWVDGLASREEFRKLIEEQNPAMRQCDLPWPRL